VSTGAAVAVDIGGTKITAALVGDNGWVGPTTTVATPAAEGSAAVVGTVVTLVRRLATEEEARSGRRPVGVGIGAAGVVDTATGSVVAATDHIAQWSGTPLGRLVSEATGLPTKVVNDVHAHALGEAVRGAGRGRGSFLLVAAGTGLGGAFVLDGRVVAGARGASGHLGHVPCADAVGLQCACGGSGHLECVASGGGVVALAASRGCAVADARTLVRLASQGDSTARSALEVSARALGAAIGGWVNTLDPEVVVVTGGLSESGSEWWAALRAAADAEMVPATRGCAVVRAELGPEAALVGAASLVLGRVASSVDAVAVAAVGS
jgi:glucokinase